MLTLAQIIAFLKPMEMFLGPLLLNVENNTLQPKLKAWIAEIPDSETELKAFLTSVDGALDALVKVEIGKI